MTLKKEKNLALSGILMQLLSGGMEQGESSLQPLRISQRLHMGEFTKQIQVNIPRIS